MGRQIAIVLYVAAMAALIIGLDVVFFRDGFSERLMLNVGIVLVFRSLLLEIHRCPWSPFVTIFARLPDLLGTVQREDSNTLIQRSRSSLAVLRRLIILHSGGGVLMDS
jgi:hypothetical protein